VTIERQTSRISDEKLVELFSLGDIYMSDFIDARSDPPPRVPLTLALDRKSGLLQLKHTAPFDQMYQQYWYRSGINKTMTAELKGIARKAVTLIKCAAGDIVLDIGCNDGTLLRFYPESVKKVGFDPAKNLRKYSEKYADLVVTDYFTAARYFQELNKPARIVTTIAMFYDLEDPHKFVADVQSVLDKEGLWIIQMSYMPLMLAQLAFDNICHEHLEYYSLGSLEYLLKQHGLKAVDVELNDINGGSFRIYVRKQAGSPSRFATAPYRDVARLRVDSLLEYEKSLKLDDPATYTAWFEKILALKKQTVAIWGYGASTKGNTLLQFFGLDDSVIGAIAERNPDKYGRRTAGTNIIIKSEAEMRKARPDYLLILPWHFVAEFREREKEYLKSGGRFIIPCPGFEVISG
jgi:hypothetical protein